MEKQSYLAPSLSTVLVTSINDAIERGSDLVSIERLLLALVKDEAGRDMLSCCGADPAALEEQLSAYLESENVGTYADSPQLLRTLAESKRPEILLAEETYGLDPNVRKLLAEADWSKSAATLEFCKKIAQGANDVVMFCDKTAADLKANSNCCLVPSLERALLSTVFQLFSGQQFSIRAGDLLAGIFSATDSPAVRMLLDQGVQKIDVLTYISHGISKQKTSGTDSTPVEPAVGFWDNLRLYDVRLHNDNYTSMEFVSSILISEFGKSERLASQIMMRVHLKGIAVVGCYPIRIARSKARLVTSLARAKGFPLLCTVESKTW